MLISSSARLDSPPDIVRQYLGAVKRFERTGDVAGLAALFANDAVLSGELDTRTAYGIPGVYRYWRERALAYRRVETSFKRVLFSEDAAALEWSAKVQHRSGIRARIEGLTLLTFDCGRITMLKSYSNLHGELLEEPEPPAQHRTA